MEKKIKNKIKMRKRIRKVKPTTFNFDITPLSRFLLWKN